MILDVKTNQLINRFTTQPRLVYHIDDAAVGALTRYYRSVLYEGANVLDICSSWVSHYPIDLRLGKELDWE